MSKRTESEKLRHVRGVFSSIDPNSRLEYLRGKLLGAFGTLLNCNCGCEIRDHATEMHSEPPSWRPPTFGPVKTPHEILGTFSVLHEYYCDACGAMYRNEVIEGMRGYTPREKKEDLE